MQSCRVLVVTTEAPDVTRSGLSVFNNSFWKELDRREFSFRTLYLNCQNTEPSRITNYEVSVEEGLPFDSNPESSAINKAWTTRQRLQPILDDYRPDVISVHENWTVLPFYFELEKVQFTLHASYIGMMHYLTRTQAGLQYYWEQRIALRQTAAAVMHSDWTCRMANEHIASDGALKHVFPIGLDFSDYPAEKIHHPDGKIVVSFFGRLGDPLKNFTSFRNAILMLPSEFRSRIEPRVYAPEPMPKGLLEAGFKEKGYVSGDLKKRAFAESDIVIMPSTHEGFGLVGLEALLSNCALIATPGLGMDEYMPEEYGCEPTAVAIKTRLIDYIRNFETIRMKQGSGHYRSTVARPEFSVETMTEKYIEIWSGIANRNSA